MISQCVGARAITIKCPHMVFYGNTSDAIILLSQKYLALGAKSTHAHNK